MKNRWYDIKNLKLRMRQGNEWHLEAEVKKGCLTGWCPKIKNGTPWLSRFQTRGREVLKSILILSTLDKLLLNDVHYLLDYIQ